MEFLITDELSIVSSDLWTDVTSSLAGMFMTIPEKEFGCLSVMTAADLLQLPPVREKDSMKHLLGLQLWHLFKYAELTKVVRQNDRLFIDLPNKVRVGKIDNDIENLLKARSIHESDENYRKDILHMYERITCHEKE